VPLLDRQRDHGTPNSTAATSDCNSHRMMPSSTSHRDNAKQTPSPPDRYSA
jgi:hypothetical protein